MLSTMINFKPYTFSFPLKILDFRKNENNATKRKREFKNVHHYYILLFSDRITSMVVIQGGQRVPTLLTMVCMN